MSNAPNTSGPTDADRSMEITNADEYMKIRVEDQLAWYSRAATRAKRKHMAIQSSLIVCAAAVPVVVNLPTMTIGPVVVSQVFATVLALVVAVLTGLANFRKDGELWLGYRTTEELLKQEKFMFRTRCGAYRDSDNCFPIFVARVEGVISSEHNKFRSIIEESSHPTKQESS